MPRPRATLAVPLLLSLAGAAAHEHDCVHDKVRARAPAPVVVPQSPLAQRRLGRRRLEASPPALRILFDTDTLVSDERSCRAAGQVVAVGDSHGSPCRLSSADDCDYTCRGNDVLRESHTARLTQELLPAVAGWFGAAFDFRDHIPRPERLVVDASRECGFGGPVRIPSDLGSPGKRDADLIVLVTVRPMAPGSATLAFAGYCQTDEGTPSIATESGVPYSPRRPILGHVNIRPSVLTGMAEEEWGSPAAVDRLMKLLLHEVFHVLGFTADKLAEWPCPRTPLFNRHQRYDWRPRDCPAVGGVPGVEPVGNFRRQHNGAAYEVRGVRTPVVLAKARHHFDCRCQDAGESDCIEYISLEDSGGEGTAASHWEKRVLYNEVMSGTVNTATSPISNITLALFEDSGWFRPNYGVAAPECFFDPSWCGLPGGEGTRPRKPLLWGAGRGCGFVMGACDGDAWRGDLGYFCTDYSHARGCTVGRRAVGRCSRMVYSADLPRQFQYFADARVGGQRSEDYCPVWEAFSNYGCGEGGEEGADMARLKAAQRGEARCEGCRCAATTLCNSSHSDCSAGREFGCYEHRCLSPTRLQMRVGNTWFDCAEQLTPSRISLPGYAGELECPPAAELCASAAELGWPDLRSVEPTSGPAGGGTVVTIRGADLGAADSRVVVCGVEASGVRPLNVSDVGGGLRARLGALVDSDGAEVLGDTSCNVRVSHSGGRYDELAAAFVYVGPPAPPPAQEPVDLSGGWTSQKVLSVSLRIWPYVMTGLTVLLTLNWCYVIVTQCRAQSRIAKAYGGGGGFVRQGSSSRLRRRSSRARPDPGFGGIETAASGEAVDWD